VDGTTGLQSLLTGIGLKILPLSVLYSVPKLVWQYNYGRFDTGAATKYFRDLAGISKEDVMMIGSVNYRKRVQPAIFREARECIAYRKSLGRTVVFLTSSFSHIVQPLADELKVEHVLSNRLLYENDRTTGFLEEPFIFGEEKRRAALSFMEEYGFSPKDCSFFTDSVNDSSLLEIVGEPVAVNPEPRLRKIACERGWKIERFEKK
ncbi:MAG: HAD family hydrolase, partial [Bacteroidota bacterium]